MIRVYIMILVGILLPIYPAQVDTTDHDFSYSPKYVDELEYYKNFLLFDDALGIEIGCVYNIQTKERNYLCAQAEILDTTLHNIKINWFHSIVIPPHKFRHQKGTAVYKTRILSNLSQTVISNKSFFAVGAFRLWAKQGDTIRLIGKAGIVGTDETNSRTAFTNELYYFENKGKPFDILIEVSNFHRDDGGIGEFFITDKKNGEWRFRKYIWTEWFIAGFILLAGLYHILFFILFKKIESSFWFGMFCLSVCPRGLLTSRVVELVFDPILFHNWRERIEFGTVVFPSLFFVYYIHQALFAAVPRRILEYYTFYCSLVIVYLFFGDNNYFANNLIIFQLCALVAVVLTMFYLIKYSFFVRRKSSIGISKMLLYSGIIFMLTVLWDIASTANLIPYRGQYSSVGLLIFILGQTYIISYKGSVAQKSNIKLTQTLKDQVKQQTQRITRVHELSREIQDSTDIEKLWQSFKATMKFEFGIDNFTLYLKEASQDSLKFYKTETSAGMPINLPEELAKERIEMSHPKSLHGLVVRRGRPIFLRRLTNQETSPTENRNRKLIRMRCIYIIPIKMEGETFALFSFTDSDYQMPEDRKVHQLTKTQRNEIELLCSYVSSGLFQSLQKEQLDKTKTSIESAYRELKSSRTQLARAEADSHLSTLAAYMAHEVNNPLNYISTSMTNMSVRADNIRRKINSVIEDSDDGDQFRTELDEMWDQIFKHFQYMAEGTKKINDIVEEVRDITGLDGIHVSTFDVVEVLKEEIAFTQEKNHVSDGVVEITINEQNYKEFSSKLNHSMQTGKELVKRCFRTMMSEALYFSRTIEDKQPVIHIELSSSYGADGTKMYIISFSNNGRPIRSENVEDVFDAKLNKGHGAELIGLPSVKAIISKLNGTVVLSDRGQTSGWVTFSITIPEIL